MTNEELKEDAIESLAQITEDFSDDVEQMHILADDLLCFVLERLGFKEVVEAYNRVPKWYS